MKPSLDPPPGDSTRSPRVRWPLGLLGTMLFVFLVVAFVELYLLYQLTKHTHLLVTIAVTLASGMVGSYMMKREGFSVLTRLRTELAQGQFPAEALLDGMFVLIGGAFLLTPGLLTDLIGFTTLVPACRKFYGVVATRLFRRHFRFFRVVSEYSEARRTRRGPTTRRPAPGGSTIFEAPEGTYGSKPKEDPAPTPKPENGAGDAETIDVQFRRIE